MKAVLLRPSLVIFFSCAAVLACGSLLNETQRIEKLYNLKFGAVPQVTATDPADNTIAPYNQSYIDITFSTEIDVATFTPQASFGTCTGSVQLSYDGFMNCLGGTVDSAQNPRIRFSPTIFPKGLGLQIRVTNAVLSAVGVPASPYTSAVGFKLAAPCGNQNCFFSYSTPLVRNAGALSGVFLIRGGTHAGKYLVYVAGSNQTTIVDVINGTSSAGPNLCGSPANGTVNFYRPVDSVTDKNKQIILYGAGGNRCTFDHDNNFFSGGGTAVAVGDGAHIFPDSSGAATGDIYIVAGGGTNVIAKYDKTTGTIAAIGTTTANTGAGARSLRLINGTNAGNVFMIAGNNSQNTRVFDEAGPAMNNGKNTAAAVNNGGSAFEIFSGANSGNVLVVHGGSTGTTSLFGLGSTLISGVTTGSGPSLAGGVTVSNGGLLLRQAGTATENNPLLIAGGTNFNTNRYDSAGGSFILGPVTTGRFASGSSSIYVSGANGGGFFMVNGTSASTSAYIPGSGTFHGSRTPADVPNAGSNAFVISAGSNTGRTLIVAGNLSVQTAIFDPLRLDMQPGPNLVNPGTMNSFNIPITRGPLAGRAVVFMADGTGAYNLYEPSNNSFSAPGALALGNIGAGAVAFPVIGSPNIIVVRGGGNPLYEIYDQDNNSLGTAASVGCTVNSTAFTLRYARPSTGEQKQLVFCSGTTMRVFDHATQSFISSLTLSGAGGAGMQGFVIASGTHKGKVLIIHGGGTNTTTLIDSETSTVDPAPVIDLSSCGVNPDGGAQALQLTTGINAGEVLILLAGASGSQATCFYDPAVHSFSAGPSVGNMNSPGFEISQGALAFRTNGGLYPTSFIILSGASKNVWNVYVP